MAWFCFEELVDRVLHDKVLWSGREHFDCHKYALVCHSSFPSVTGTSNHTLAFYFLWDVLLLFVWCYEVKAISSCPHSERYSEYSSSNSEAPAFFVNVMAADSLLSLTVFL